MIVVLQGGDRGETSQSRSSAKDGAATVAGGLPPLHFSSGAHLRGGRRACAYVNGIIKVASSQLFCALFGEVNKNEGIWGIKMSFEAPQCQ